MKLMPELIYCAGGNKRFANIAITHGFHYGARLPSICYYPITFADQDFKKPNKERYIEEVIRHKPKLATVIDYMEGIELSECLDWADKIADHVSEIIIIPKISGTIHQIPLFIKGKPVRIGYSVATSYGDSGNVELWELGKRQVHLLGGSPHDQFNITNGFIPIRGKPGYYQNSFFKPNVVSADTNYHQKQAIYNRFFVNGYATKAINRWFPQLSEYDMNYEIDNPYYAFDLACMNIKSMWIGTQVMIRYAVENDLQVIKNIANQYSKELGFVMLPALKESMQRHTLIVACIDNKVCGFVNYRHRKDNWNTIYEIAVHKDYVKNNIGKGLLASVPYPKRLKVTTDNHNAIRFYISQGMVWKRIENGKKRKLFVMEMQ